MRDFLRAPAAAAVVGTPPLYRLGAEARVPALHEEFAPQGVEHWARQSMAGRLGSTFPPQGVAWWTTCILGTAERSQIDQGIREQLHPIVPLLDAFKTKQ